MERGRRVEFREVCSICRVFYFLGDIVLFLFFVCGVRNSRDSERRRISLVRREEKSD